MWERHSDFFRFKSEILSIFCLCVFAGGMGHDCRLLDDLSVSEVETFFLVNIFILMFLAPVL